MNKHDHPRGRPRWGLAHKPSRRNPKKDYPTCHGKRLTGRKIDRTTKRAKRRLIRDVDHFRGVKAARTRLINRTTGRILVAFDFDDDGYSNAGRIRAILEDVL